jgi:hypothetical protein
MKPGKKRTVAAFRGISAIGVGVGWDEPRSSETPGSTFQLFVEHSQPLGDNGQRFMITSDG